MTLREALQSIYDEYGKLTPDLVVEEARKNEGEAGHLLHARLEWDNEKASESWRREQARGLIRSVRVVYKKADEDGPSKSVRGFHSVQSEKGNVYVPLEEVEKDEFTRKLILANMQREWEQLFDRYKQFEEFVELVERDLQKV